MPMARKTWLGSREWLEQALPPATQMPSWSKRSTMVSLSHSSARPWTMLGRKSRLPASTSTVGWMPSVAAMAA